MLYHTPHHPVMSRWEHMAQCVTGFASPSGIHPAAHLDPGPTGHDIYGRHGHALGLTAMSLDPREAEGELARKRAAPVSSHDLLRHSRTLLARSLVTLGEGGRYQRVHQELRSC